MVKSYWFLHWERKRWVAWLMSFPSAKQLLARPSSDSFSAAYSIRCAPTRLVLNCISIKEASQPDGSILAAVPRIRPSVTESGLSNSSVWHENMGGTVTEQVASFPGTVASPTTRRDTVLV